jgi:hypothetical protein
LDAAGTTTDAELRDFQLLKGIRGNFRTRYNNGNPTDEGDSDTEA